MHVDASAVEGYKLDTSIESGSVDSTLHSSVQVILLDQSPSVHKLG